MITKTGLSLIFLLLFTAGMFAAEPADPWHPRPPAGEVSFFHHTKSTIAYRYWNKEAGSKTMLFLYGFGGNMDMVDYFVSQFSSEYRILSIDYPGHGCSPLAKQKLTIDDLSAILRDLLTELEEEKIYLAGYSLGGVAALHLSALLQDRVKKLVLWNTIPHFAYNQERETFFKIINNMLTRNYPFTVTRIAIPMLRDKFFSYTLMKTAREVALYNDPASVLAVFSMTVNSDATTFLKKITCPVLVLYSGKDPLVPPEAVESFTPGLKKSTSILFPKHGHLSMVSDRKTFIKIITAFINE